MVDILDSTVKSAEQYKIHSRENIEDSYKCVVVDGLEGKKRRKGEKKIQGKLTIIVSQLFGLSLMVYKV